MRNLWIQTENAFATWVADLTSPATRPIMPDALLAFAIQVLRAGAEHQVFLVKEAPLLGYRHEHDGELIPRLEELYREQGVVDLFGFTEAAMAPGAPGSSTVGAKLAWFDQHDQQVEGICVDLGSLLQRLEPVPGAIPRGFMKRFPPLRITGPRLSYRGDPPVLEHPQRPIAVRIAIHSDIWFPWVFGSAHPDCDHRRMFDNRALAMVHTPRLNRFLAAVARSTKELGGTWDVDSDETGANAILWLDERGIDLEAKPRPEDIMPASALDAEWF